MIRDVRRIILDYANQMNRLERWRDYRYIRNYECVLSEFKFLNQYCSNVIAHFPYISVNKRILCLEGFYLPLFMQVREPTRMRIFPGAILVV